MHKNHYIQNMVTGHLPPLIVSLKHLISINSNPVLSVTTRFLELSVGRAITLCLKIVHRVYLLDLTFSITELKIL